MVIVIDKETYIGKSKIYFQLLNEVGVQVAYTVVPHENLAAL